MNCWAERNKQCDLNKLSFAPFLHLKVDCQRHMCKQAAEPVVKAAAPLVEIKRDVPAGRKQTKRQRRS